MANSIETQDASTIHRYAIKAWFIGSDFIGSQRQPNKRTVEGELIWALKKRRYIIDPEEAKFRVSARTDAGVHARTYVFAFNSLKKLHLSELDAFLPDDLGVWAWTEVPIEFHPRYMALNKEYYYLYLKKQKEQLNFTFMQEAANKLVGTHNFRLLSKKDLSKGDDRKEITLFRVDLKEISDIIIFNFKANAFLWQLIRRSVQFLLEIGRGYKKVEDVVALFEKENVENTRLKKVTPERSDGLILWDMEYDPNIKFKEEPKCMTRMTNLIGQSWENLTIKAKIIEFWQGKNYSIRN